MKVREYNKLTYNEKLELLLQRKKELQSKKRLNIGELNALTLIDYDIKELKKEYGKIN